MAKHELISVEVASNICLQHVGAIHGASEYVDIRRTKTKHEVYHCYIVNDYCVAITTNSESECKGYIRHCVGAVAWTEADTRNWPDPYRGMKAWVGRPCNANVNQLIVLYKTQ